MIKLRTMVKGTIGSNIPRYLVYTALKGVGFGLFLPIWMIYLQQQRGLSMSQAALVDVTFARVTRSPLRSTQPHMPTT